MVVYGAVAAGGAGGQKSSTTGWRVGSQVKRSTGTPQSGRPRFSPKVNSTSWAASCSTVLASPSTTPSWAATGSLST